MTSIIETIGVTKKFKDFTAVDDISFSVEKGEIFAFLGPNGAGKTATLEEAFLSLIGTMEFGYTTDITVLVIVSGVLLVIGSWLFSRIQV